MDYKKHYEKLIERSLTRGLDKRNLDYYVELHHIIPRALDGSDDTSNLVLLTPEEHYVAHQLLFKIHKTRSTLYAVVAMTAGRKSNKVYGWTKRLLSEMGKSDEHKKNISIALKGRKLSPEHKKNLSEWQKGRKLSSEHIGNMSVSITNALNTEEYKKFASEHSKKNWSDPEYKKKTSKAISDSLKGKPQKRKICPHCNRDISVSAYPRFHGDKCKMRNNDVLHG